MLYRRVKVVYIRTAPILTSYIIYYLNKTVTGFLHSKGIGKNALPSRQGSIYKDRPILTSYIIYYLNKTVTGFLHSEGIGENALPSRLGSIYKDRPILNKLYYILP